MFTIFFHPGPIRNTQNVVNCDFDAFKLFFNSLLEHGIYFAPSQYECGFISLSHTKELLDIAIMQIDAALKEIFIHAEL
jgi:glutamate-1-semialdehyde 2,1-aminomutase